MQCDQLYHSAISNKQVQCTDTAICVVGTLTDHGHNLCKRHAIDFVCFLDVRVSGR